MRFLVDAQLPPLVAAWLRQQGHEAEHVFERGDLEREDDAIWLLAVELGAVVVTKDRDFVEWSFARNPAPQVLWLRFGNMRNTPLQHRLWRVWPRLLEALESGAPVVEAQ